MNLILLFPEDFINANTVVLTDRRHAHITEIHRPTIGQALRVGLLNGKLGTGEVIAISAQSITLAITLHQQPPKTLPVTLILALPRPKMLKRIYQTIAAMGVERLIVINSYRVEKSYWHTPALLPATIRSYLLLGLEQARDTSLPEISLQPRFKPFVEDKLPTLSANTKKLLAHPGSNQPCPRRLNTPTTLVIGPEGGFIPYEIDQFTRQGFTPICLGERILRVETAIPAALGKLF